MEVTEIHRRYWQKTLRLTAVLLVVWFVVTYVMAFFARDLASINFFGWPLSFYIGAQGALIVYCLIIWYYAKRMNELDAEHGVAEEEE